MRAAAWDYWIPDEDITRIGDDARAAGDRGREGLCVLALRGDHEARRYLGQLEADRPIGYALTDEARAELAARAASSGGAS